MKLILTLLLVLNFSAVYSQTSNAIVIGNADSVYSKTLNENRKIWVYVPNTLKNSLYGKQNYPVVYLLDGDAHFYSLVGLIKELSENGNMVCPQMIVVGILNADRTRDLTPSHDAAEASSGGGENFSYFLEKELMPYINAHYPTAPYRMLIGHSYGGLTAVNELAHHSHLFNTYVAIDPTLKWDNQKLLKECDAILNQEQLGGKRLVLSMANSISREIDTLVVKNDTTQRTLNWRSILMFLDMLCRSAKNNGLKWDFKYYDKDDHHTVPLIAEYDALRYAFEFYRVPIDKILDKKNNSDSLVEAHFVNVSKQMGYTILPPEELVNLLGYDFLSRKKFEPAELFFKKNVANYPQSSNVFYSMGFFYETTGDKLKAVENYTKALSIKESPDLRKRVEAMKARLGK
jgi:predicted alpha/beta superfamily hydrolase